MNYSPIETTEPILVLGSKLFWRHRRAAAAICCVTLVASIFYALSQAPTYTADAQIVPTSRRTENGPRGDTIATIDAQMLLQGQLQLLKSQRISRSIAEQLSSTDIAAPQSGREMYVGNFVHALDSATAATPRSRRETYVAKFVHRLVRAKAAALTEIELDRGLRYSYQPRMYFITASFTSSSPERAAAFANAVASQFVHAERMKELASRLAEAQRVVSERSAIYGPKHPTVLRAETKLNQLTEEFENRKTRPLLLSAPELDASGLAVAAHASAARRNTPNATILSGLLLGILLSIAFVFWAEHASLRNAILERFRWR
jgi:uncharacterized protein involved in exopolysaccharide biosynthesis